jgi:hypothetical protein
VAAPASGESAEHDKASQITKVEVRRGVRERGSSSSGEARAKCMGVQLELTWEGV